MTQFLLVISLASGASLCNWHVSKRDTHDALVQLCQHTLLHGPRALAPECVHVETAVSTLPARYGLPTSAPRGLLTPDLIAADDDRLELLIIECTVVPDAALPRYIGRKAQKYRGLCSRSAKKLSSDLCIDSPLIVALGVGGGVPTATQHALARILGLGSNCACDDVALRELMTAASEIAMSRADAPVVRKRGAFSSSRKMTRRERWRARALQSCT